jgi:CHAD domain-containing protein
VAYELTATEPLADGLKRCADEQLDRAIKALTRELDLDPVEAVHTARKAIKKERALLRLARGSLPAGQRSAENAALREAAGRLSGMRDAEVMLQTLLSLSNRYGDRLPAAVIGTLRERLEHDREAERAQRVVVRQTVDDLRACRRRVRDWRLAADSWQALAPGLERTYRDARQAMRRARREPTLENLHEWRKRVKDTWYELRLLAPVCGPIVRGAVEEAQALSEVLGEEHDLGVLAARVRELGGQARRDDGQAAGLDGQAAGLDGLIALIAERRGELQARAQMVGRRLYAEKPSSYARRLGRLWKAGRAQFAAYPITSLRPNTRSNALSSP